MTSAGSALQRAVVVVAGASIGIGRATARVLTDWDATVVDASQVALRQVAAECGDLGGTSAFRPTSVTRAGCRR
ncbi:MAG: SDR family NAD(P)-dependent oxidoreductase [Chloroflexi bacterium]|nr:SDR family NAD(P)-dependent oxidoreductase [Chloroflexota bacterium]